MSSPSTTPTNVDGYSSQETNLIRGSTRISASAVDKGNSEFLRNCNNCSVGTG